MKGRNGERREDTTHIKNGENRMPGGDTTSAPTDARERMEGRRGLKRQEGEGSVEKSGTVRRQSNDKIRRGRARAIDRELGIQY